MSHSAFVLAILTSSILPAAAMSAEKSPAWTPADMMRVQRIGPVAVSPDGQRVAFSVRRAEMEGSKSEHRTHIHLARTDGKEARQLTQGEKSCDHPQWSPDGNWIAFLSSRVGKKNIWIIAPTGGEAQQLMELPTDVSSFQWSPDGRWIAFTALEAPSPAEEKAIQEKNDARVADENVKRSRLHVVPFALPLKASAKPRLLTPRGHSVGGEGSRTGPAAYNWSPDSKSLAFCHTSTPRPQDWTSADLSVVDVASGAIRPLVHAPAAEYAPLWSPDGRWIAYVASDSPPTWGGTGRVFVTTPTGETPRPLAETFDSFGRYSELVGWSADSQKLYFTEVRGTALRLGALPLQGDPIEIGKEGGMGASGVSLNASRKMLGFSWETLNQPAEAHVSPADAFKPVRVSQVQDPALAQLPRGRTELVRWKSTDGFEIEGLLTYPVAYEKGQRYPLLLNIHGGPMGVFTQSFVGAPGPYPLAALAARGYAVLRCNIRGSSGYGRTFRYANYGDWGGGDYRDLMAGVDHVIALGVADPDRLGVMGWSYGGFMTSWIITQTPRFQAASVGAGVTNLMSFTGTADIPGFLPDYFGGEFWDKPEAYRAHSAMFHIKGVRTPTLIQHGERDERVPLSQGQELYNALKRQGCVTKMVIYPRTPHGIEEPRLLLDCMERNLEWFERHVQRRGVQP